MTNTAVLDTMEPVYISGDPTSVLMSVLQWAAAGCLKPLHERNSMAEAAINAIPTEKGTVTHSRTTRTPSTLRTRITSRTPTSISKEAASETTSTTPKETSNVGSVPSAVGSEFSLSTFGEVIVVS